MGIPSKHDDLELECVGFAGFSDSRVYYIYVYVRKSVKVYV
jgi:hypothetical protein